MENVYSRILLLLFVTNVVRTYEEPSKLTDYENTSDKERNIEWACYINVEGKYCSGVVLTTYFVLSSRRCYKKYCEYNKFARIFFNRLYLKFKHNDPVFTLALYSP